MTHDVITGGRGFAGAHLARELRGRGHDVTVLEAAGRTGGHVRTIRDPLADGLYVDGGAEHFTRPGYEIFWGYVKEFNLKARAYHRRENMLRVIDGKLFTEEMLADPKVLSGFGFVGLQVVIESFGVFAECLQDRRANRRLLIHREIEVFPGAVEP